MKSPFPGMDPYLEQPGTWSDFHGTFYVEIKAALNTVLPPGFVARSDRYVWIHEPEAKDRILVGKPDAFVARLGTAGEPLAKTAMRSAPAMIVLPAVRREGDRYLKIVDVQGHRVVTVIELLSPSNKTTGPDRDAYLMKRNEYLATGVNLIEMDLLRGGERMPWGAAAPTSTDYYVMICRAWEFPRADMWPISVRDSLPTISVPLLQGIDEPELPLQECFESAYRRGRYETEIDYRQPPPRPLRDVDSAWAASLLKQAR